MDYAGREAFRKSGGLCDRGMRRVRDGTCSIQFPGFPSGVCYSDPLQLPWLTSTQVWVDPLEAHPSFHRIIYFVQNFPSHFILERPSQKDRGTSVLHLVLTQVENHLRAKWRA